MGGMKSAAVVIGLAYVVSFSLGARAQQTPGDGPRYVNGQNLVRSLNGGPSATQLGHWLATSFPNMYASLDGMTNAGVAAYYKGLFARTSQTAPGGPPKVDCQVMATALAIRCEMVSRLPVRLRNASM